MFAFLSIMLGWHLRDDDRDAFGGGDVQKLVGAMRVRVRAEHARDDKLCLWKLPPSMAMNGMVPPSPIWAGASKVVSEARASDCSSQGDRAGVCHPTSCGSGS